ncbi:hypothetical protein AAKU55_002199 [Oxalobacteraceae bacterium GrIS 1.11]
MKSFSLPRQRGIALPIMLIMLAVMLVSGVYLLRSSNSSTMLASNLAYDTALTRAVDLGMLTSFQWLSDTGKFNKPLLDNNNPVTGYVSNYNPAQAVSSTAFWAGSRVVNDGANNIEVVIHRMCANIGPYNIALNTCMLTAHNNSATVAKPASGTSLSSDGVKLAPMPEIHYIVTARIFGARGGNVVSQTVVMIGA